MNKHLRKHVASAFLLLPLTAAMVAVLPATVQAQQSRLEIRALQASTDGRIEPGALLTFRLEGTPRAQATVRIGGMDRAIALEETGYGVYTGSYTLRRADRISADSPVRATIDDGRRAAAADYALAEILPQTRAPVATPRPVPETRQSNADRQAPRLKFLDPADGQTVPGGPSIHIAATFDDVGGSGVDPSTVRVVVSGRDITAQTQITRQTLSFWGPLPSGRHTVEVTARDLAGNAMRSSWSFEVARAGVPAPVAVPVPLPVPPPRIIAAPVLPSAASLAVQVVNLIPNTEIGPDPAVIVARTAPNALVSVRVDAFPPPTVNAPPRVILAQTLRADHEGIARFTMVPGIPTPGERYEISLVAGEGNIRGPESRLTLIQRPN